MIPPRHVVAAVDFSEPSRAALEMAARLAAHCGAALHVLHVEDPLLHAAARATHVDLAKEISVELTQFVRSTFPALDASPRYHIVVGRPVDVICEVANRERIDLIVVGARGMSGPSHAVFGSTAEGVLVRSDVSVLLVPPSWQPPRPESPDLSGIGPVVAGIEMSVPALAATKAACRLARVLGTTVDAVHVVPAIRVLERWRLQAEHAVEERTIASRRELSEVLQSMAPEVQVRLVLKSGDVPARFEEALREGGGAHGMLVLGRRAPGSKSGPPGAFAARILARYPVPVLVYLADE